MKVTDKAVFETTMGEITIGLYKEEMPVTVDNFIRHVEAGYYDGLLFHRVIENFVIQGGGLIKGMHEKKAMGEPIKLEINPEILHKKYTISMARTSDPNSATSQFFICNANCPSLDNNYAAFGVVVEGMEVVDEISKVQTHSAGMYDDVPVEPVVIKKSYMVK